VRPRARRRFTVQRRTAIVTAVCFLLPAVLVLLLFRLSPAVQAISNSLYRTGTLSGVTEFVGFENFVFIFTESQTFLPSLGITIFFLFLTVAIETTIALALAVLFTRQAWGSKVFRTFVILPITIPAAVSVTLWGTAFRGDGIINGILISLGLPEQPFLTSSGQALLCFVVVMGWIGVGYWMVFLMAGINDVPDSVREAATLDGAGPVRQFFSIVLPLLRRPLAFVVVANTIGSFLLFVPASVLTKGGPENSTRLVMFEIYDQAFNRRDLGVAYAEIVVVLVVLLTIVGLQFRFLNGKD
jgi:multiple sugar transport system permease protein